MIELHKASDKDITFLYDLRTDPVASRMSRRPPPTLTEHMHWWGKTTDLIYVAEWDRVRVGMMRVSVDGVVSIIVHPELRGQGFGEPMLRALETHARGEGHRHLIAEVAYENMPSQRIFGKAEWRPILFERYL